MHLRLATPTKRAFGIPILWALFVCLATLGPGSEAHASKTDVVILNNDDHITGEVKLLERGRLKFKTDAADNIFFEWGDVRRVTSDASFEIEVRSGRRYFGTLAPSSGNRRLHVVGLLDSLVLDFDDVVYIVPIKSTFWARIDGSVDLGLSYTQANVLLQWTFAGEIQYRAPNFFSRLTLNSTISDQEEVKRTSRQDLTLRNSRFFKNHLMSNIIYSMMHNDELGVDLRITLSGSGGSYWLKTNTSVWGGFIGLSVTTEQATSAPGFDTQLELPLTMEFESFTYSTPKRDISVTFSVIPSLTVAERVRTELNAKVSWEVVKDFYIGLSALNSTDSKPPEGAQNTTDLTFSTTLGYKF